jgi:translation initiation factor 2 subunit 3
MTENKEIEMKMENKFKKPILNIGTFGAVSEGKTSLVKVLSGTLTTRNSKEKIRNITIKLGFANWKYYDDENNLIHHISFVDCPGHHEYINTMLSGINIIDGAIVIISVNSKIKDKPQLIQHLGAIKVGNIKKIIICLNKIDLVSKDTILERKEELDELLKEYDIKPFVIIPTSFTKNLGVNYLKQAIMLLFEPNDIINKDDKENIFRITRSFDINKPNTDWKELKGGVIGGSVTSGTFKIGDEIEIKPGYKGVSLKTKIISLQTEDIKLDVITKGGLIGIGTDLDPFYCKDDFLAGQICSLVNKLSDNITSLTINYEFVTIFGFVWKPVLNDIVTLQIGTTIIDAKLVNLKKNIFELSKPCCILESDSIVICKKINNILRIVAKSV